jgi:hypothetical protein
VINRIIGRNDMKSFIDGIVTSFADRLEFQPLRPADDELRAWVEWNIDISFRWLQSGQPPTEEELDSIRELARLCAAEDAPADTILANYRLGARFVWEVMLSAATTQERLDLLDAAGLIFEFVDTISRTFSVAYDEAMRAVPQVNDEHSAQVLIAKLEANEELSIDDRRFADQIGFSLDGPFLPAVLMSRGISFAKNALLARRLRSMGALPSSTGRRVTVISNSPLPWRDIGIGDESVLAEGEATSAARLGAVIEDLWSLAEVAITRGRSGSVHPDEFQAEVILHRSPRTANALYERIYGKLEADNPELARTLDSFVEHNFDRGQTAEALPVHRNTLAYRLDRISSLIGLDTNTADGLGLAWLARKLRAEVPPATS